MGDGVNEVIVMRSAYVGGSGWARGQCSIGEWDLSVTVLEARTATLGGTWRVLARVPSFEAPPWCSEQPMTRAGWLDDGTFLVFVGERPQEVKLEVLP